MTRCTALRPVPRLLLTVALTVSLSAAQAVAADDAKSIAGLEAVGATLKLNDAKEVVAINFGEHPVTDADLALLPGVPKVEQLVVTGPAVGDEQLGTIAKSAKLKDLSLENTSVTDAGLARLAPWRHSSP